MSQTTRTTVIILIIVISLIIIATALLMLYNERTSFDLNNRKKSELNGFRFQPTILYYSETDRNSMISSKWRVSGGAGFNDTNFSVHNVLLDKKSLFMEAWLELKDGDFISDQHYCDYDTVCFGGKNPIGY